MNILEAAKKEKPQCVGWFTEEDVILTLLYYHRNRPTTYKNETQYNKKKVTG
jgi:hypothetical protein